MKRLALALTMLAQAAQADPLADEQAAVMKAVLSFYAGALRVPHHLDANRKSCIDPKLEGEAIAGSVARLRERYRESSRERMLLPDGTISPPSPPLPDDKIEQQVKDFAWQVREGEGEAASRGINEAAVALIYGAPQPRLTRIEKSMLAGRQVLSVSQSGCVDTMQFSPPEISGRYAFLSISQNCGVLCGLRARLVFEKRADGWQFADGAIDMIS
jgi:hypothetical protein